MPAELNLAEGLRNNLRQMTGLSLGHARSVVPKDMRGGVNLNRLRRECAMRFSPNSASDAARHLRVGEGDLHGNATGQQEL